MKVEVIRRLLTVHLKLDESTVDFLKLTFVVVEPSVVGDSRVEPPDELKGEVDGVHSRFPFLA